MVKQKEVVHRILVVDDDELVSEYLNALLEAEGYAAKIMNDPVAALNYFNENTDEFDLVITDQVMPDLTGVELTESILKVQPDIPVILITGYSETISAENAASFGVKQFFLKPINEKKLLDAISILLTKKLV